MTAGPTGVHTPGIGERLWNAAPVLLTLANLFWAGNFIVGRAAALMPGGLDALGLAFWRWLAAFVIVAAIAGRRAWSERAEVMRHLPLLSLYGLLSVTFYNTFVYLGLRETTALNALLLQSAMPLVVMATGAILFRDRIGLWQGVGIGVSLLGVLTILTRGAPQQLASLDLGHGGLLVLLGVVGNAVYFATLRKRPALHPLSFIVVTFGLGLVFLTPAYLLFSRPMTRPVMPADVGLVLYLAVCASIVALLFFNRGIQLVGASRAAPYLHLMPLLGSLLSILLLGETFRLFHLVGMALIFAGIWLASAARGARRPEAGQPSP